MKLRIDLLEYMRPEDILDFAGWDIERWSAEPVFGRTGKGHLGPMTPELRAKEMEMMEEIRRRLEARKAQAEQERAQRVDADGPNPSSTVRPDGD